MKIFILMSLLFASTAHAKCAPIAGLDGLFAPGRIVVVGEIHGTREMPALFTDLVCHAVARGFDVRVGFEQDAATGAALEKYLVSQGDRAERVRVVATRAQFGDGTASEAMTDAFEAVRKLALASHRIKTFAFAKVSGNVAYAATIANEHASAPRAVVLALMGNTHAQIKRDATDDEPLTGELLRKRGLDVRAIYLDYTHGTAYGHRASGEIGVYTQSPGNGAPPFRKLNTIDPPTFVYDMMISVGEIHASPPAR
jgi:hypothetical protein